MTDKIHDQGPPSSVLKPGVIGVVLAAFLGAVPVVLADLFIAGEAARLLVINRWGSHLTDLIHLGQLPLYAYALIVMVLATVVVAVFRPTTLLASALRAFAVLAVLFLLVPTDLGRSLPSPATSSANQNATSYFVRVKIEMPKGLGENTTISELVGTGGLRGRLRNEETGETYNLFRSSGSEIRVDGSMLEIVTRLEGHAPQTSLVARVELQGYRIVESRFQAKAGINSLWTMRLQPSSLPLFVQRFTRSYWF